MSALEIELSWSPRADWGAAALLRRVARQVARAEGFRRGRLSVAVVGRRAMRRLHARYLGQDTETDVLSFDLGTDRRRGVLHGEIVLCADVALRRGRARAGGRAGGRLGAARAELALYLVHGLLHLAGYDDHEPRDFARMHAREDELLTRAGVGAVFRARRSAARSG